MTWLQEHQLLAVKDNNDEKVEWCLNSTRMLVGWSTQYQQNTLESPTNGVCPDEACQMHKKSQSNADERLY